MTGLSEFLLALIDGNEGENEEKSGRENDESTDDEKQQDSDIPGATGLRPALAIISQTLQAEDLGELEEKELEEKIKDLLQQFNTIKIGINDSGELIETNVGDEKNILTIDPERAPKSRQEAGQEIIPQLHEEVEGFSTPSLSPFVYSYRQEGGEERINELSEFYQTKVPPAYVSMIEDSLMLTLAAETQDLSWREVRERKRDIRDKYYNDDAFPLSSLCAAGYLNKGGYLYELYDMIDSETENPESKYRDIFLKYVRNRPFVVFVQYNDTKEDIYHNFLAKLLRLDDYERRIEFIDIRGKGEENHKKINDAIEMIEGHHETVEYEKRHVNRDLVVQIDVTQL